MSESGTSRNALHGPDQLGNYCVVHDGVATRYRKDARTYTGDEVGVQWKTYPDVDTAQNAHQSAQIWLDPANAPTPFGM